MRLVTTMSRITADDLHEIAKGKWVLQRKPKLWLMRDFWAFVAVNVVLVVLVAVLGE